MLSKKVMNIYMHLGVCSTSMCIILVVLLLSFIILVVLLLSFIKSVNAGFLLGTAIVVLI